MIRLIALVLVLLLGGCGDLEEYDREHVRCRTTAPNRITGATETVCPAP